MNISQYRNSINDSLSYIGFIEHFYFQPEDEFYVGLYFKQNDIKFEEYEKVSRTGDSVLYADDENKRSRIPFEIANEYFDLTGLDLLSVFDNDGEFLTKAHLARIEFLDQNISPEFIAVFKPEKKGIIDKMSYGIGNLHSSIYPLHCTTIDDSALAVDILHKLNLKYAYIFSSKQYKCEESKSNFTVINYNDTVILVQNLNNEYKCIYRSPEPEYIYDLKIVPIEKNSEPIILVRCGQPDTDIEWNSLLVFDGNQYKATDRQRIII